MSTPLLSTILDAILVTLLLISCVTDWRERIIPHWLNITIALLAPISWWNHGFHLWPDVAWQLGLSISVTAFFLIFQAIGMMGGGDVKLLGALALWLNWKVMLTLLFLMSLAGGVLTIAMLIYHRARKREGNPEVPYGIAIAFAALIVICEHYFNHFS
jgi:prepilin peptidase CpaA